MFCGCDVTKEVSGVCFCFYHELPNVYLCVSDYLTAIVLCGWVNDSYTHKVFKGALCTECEETECKETTALTLCVKLEHSVVQKAFLWYHVPPRGYCTQCEWMQGCVQDASEPKVFTTHSSFKAVISRALDLAYQLLCPFLSIATYLGVGKDSERVWDTDRTEKGNQEQSHCISPSVCQQITNTSISVI